MFASYCFIPCHRQKDWDSVLGIVRATFIRLEAWRKFSPQKFNDSPVVQRSMKAMQETHEKFIKQVVDDVVMSQEDKTDG